jgi:predicted Zn-dependent protease
VERVTRASNIAFSYPSKNGSSARQGDYLGMIDGTIYGDGIKQGFARDNNFYHTQMGFTFSVPEDFKIYNRPTEVIAISESGDIILFDADKNPKRLDPLTYINRVWLNGETVRYPEEIIINGMRAATGEFDGHVNNKPVTIRIVAVEWNADSLFRFQFSIPKYSSEKTINDFKSTTYSLRRLSDQEKSSIKPYSIDIVTAKLGDTVQTMSKGQPFKEFNEDYFRVYNALAPDQQIVVNGRRYKVID